MAGTPPVRQEIPDEEFLPNLEAALNKDRWVLDGNYTRTVDIKWKDVDTVIWVDLSFLQTVWQVTKRAFKRALTKQELWEDTGNVETFGRMFSRDSIILWSIKTHSKTRRKYEAAMINEDYVHINFIRLGSRRECHDFLRNVRKPVDS
tara:strand:+ start:948 stop:1391 length:444 start_codon:yes stop_codon:yes gene_type:complete